jgi:hypothetical protein
MSQTDTRSRLFFALSPLALVAICAAIQFIAGRYVGVWAWVPTMLGFWLVIALLLHFVDSFRKTLPCLCGTNGVFHQVTPPLQ